jgi:Uma2 family endonuclease
MQLAAPARKETHMAIMSQLQQLKRVPMTREEFESLPEGPPYYDYVDGVAIEVNRPGVKHNDVVLCLGFTLRQQAGRLGAVAADVNLELPSGDVFGPDILFLSQDNHGCRVLERGDVVGVPDLIVEVLSPSTEAYDRTEKMGHYHRAEVPWLWYVGQDSLLVAEYRWSDEGYTLLLADDLSGTFRPRLFPGLEINLADLLGWNVAGD